MRWKKSFYLSHRINICQTSPFVSFFCHFDMEKLAFLASFTTSVVLMFFHKVQSKRKTFLPFYFIHDENIFSLRSIPSETWFRLVEWSTEAKSFSSLFFFFFRQSCPCQMKKRGGRAWEKKLQRIDLNFSTNLISDDASMKNELCFAIFFFFFLPLKFIT